MTESRIVAEIIHEVAGMQKQSITDAVALDLHLRHIKAAGQLPDSIRGRRGAILRLADHLDPYGERPRAVIDATSDQLAEWQASKADLAAKSLCVYIRHIQAYYRWLVRPMRILVESPAEDLVAPPVRRRQARPIAEEDLEYALDACGSPRVRAFLVLGAYAGLRSIDIAGLNRDDLLTDKKVPMLRVRGKGDNEDLIPVGAEVVNALAPYLGRRGPLFTDENGQRLNKNKIRNEVNDYLRRVGLPYTFHQARHRYGTRVYELTQDLRYTQRLLRHSSITSTEIYVAMPTAQDEQTMRALDAELARRPHRARRELGA